MPGELRGLQQLSSSGPSPTQAKPQQVGGPARIKCGCLQPESAKTANATPRYTKTQHVAICFTGSGLHAAQNRLCLRVFRALGQLKRPVQLPEAPFERLGKGGPFENRPGCRWLHFVRSSQLVKPAWVKAHHNSPQATSEGQWGLTRRLGSSWGLTRRLAGYPSRTGFWAFSLEDVWSTQK